MSGFAVEEVFDARGIRPGFGEFRIDDLYFFSGFLQPFFAVVGNGKSLFVECNGFFETGFRIFNVPGYFLKPRYELFDSGFSGIVCCHVV